MPEKMNDRDEAQARYVAQVRKVLSNPGWAEAIAPWLTSRCSECGQEPALDPDHVVIPPYVVVGCEGYHMVNPVALGLQDARTSSWIDWREPAE
ncbi:hypothetical protein [Nonomuraea sp. SYSU D8015]|uniref:hypothetical protein n=1 Tax=Nonomuraea sp. SYSU D8015 TaxID=2593644 RepID=UPI0016607062|nr:hypothetical protein [Nonomuraea sp. SYSU D8015]